MMKKAMGYALVCVSILMVCAGLYMDLVANIRMTGTQKVTIYVTPMVLLFINMIIGIKSAKDAREKEKIKTTMLRLIFTVYIISLSTVLFLGFAYRHPEHITSAGDRVNLVPFKEIAACLSGLRDGTVSTGSALVNIGGNLLAFAPMGFFIPVLFGNKIRNIGSFTLLMIIIVSAVELAQFITRTGVADIDDVILNTSGAVIVYLLRRTRLKNIWKKLIE